MITRLPRGSTGFWRPSESPRPDELLSRTELRARVHAACRRSSWSPASVDDSLRTRNYYQAILTGHRGAPDLQVVANPFVPCVAAAHVARREDGEIEAEFQLRFVELDPTLREAFADLAILSPEALRAPLTPPALAELAPAELEQVAYWNPATVGEVLFNLWD